jgi:hypothetical protein
VQGKNDEALALARTALKGLQDTAGADHETTKLARKLVDDLEKQ